MPTLFVRFERRNKYDGSADCCKMFNLNSTSKLSRSMGLQHRGFRFNMDSGYLVLVTITYVAT
jgi:hypothetical protein